MTELAAAIDIGDPILATDFIREMVRQMHAIDTYGIYEGLSVAELLDPFVLTAARRRELPLLADPDEIVVARIQAFYNAVATLIEKECGCMATPMINLTHEGFGRGLITVGKLVVMDRTMRNAHRFGFASLAAMKDEADKLLAVALELIGLHPQVAGL